MNPELNIFAFIQGLYGSSLAAAIATNVQAGLNLSRTYLHAMAAMCVFSTMIMAALHGLSFARLAGRAMRMIIVTQLIVNVDLYTRFVVTPVMTGFPNQIAQFFGGSSAKTMPDQFAAIYNAIGNISSTLRTQTNGLLQIGDRVAVWIAELIVKFLLTPQFALYSVLQLFTGLAVIAGTLVIIFFMFDFTKGFAESWFGMVVGSIVTTALISVTLQLILQMNVAFIQRQNSLPMSNAGAGVNVSAGIEVLIAIGSMLAVGIVWMILAFVIGFGIGRSSGISAGQTLRTFMRPV